MKVVFMGTPDFAVYSLDALTEMDLEIALVISQTDRPKDRGKKMQPTAVKKRAEELGLPIYQPLNIKSEEVYEKLKELDPELIIVTAYGQLLPKSILELPRYGCINVHASLLPKYRGAAPIHYALLHGEEKTGITTMYMSEGLDVGDMIYTDELSIEPQDDIQSLHDKLALLSKKTLKKTVEAIINEKAPRIVQKEEDASYASLITKEMGHLDFSKSANVLLNQTRALPSYAFLGEQRIRLFNAAIGGISESEDYGRIVRVNGDSIEVIAKDHRILFYELQFPNKKRMSVKDFLKGNQIPSGSLLE